MSADVIPLVSVVVPAFNAAQWIRQALASLQSQTLRDIEIIVVDDASTDGTAECVAATDDPRVRLIRLGQNGGAAIARTHGIQAARGEFVALMDSDDIALPHWLERQVKYLNANPECGLCGAWIETFGARIGIWNAHEFHADIKVDLLFRCGINQNTVVFRKREFERLGLGYDPNFRVAEDYDLWSRCADLIHLHNTQEVLVRYRIHDSNSSISERPLLRTATRIVRARQLEKLGIFPTEQELDLHDALGEYGPSGSRRRRFDVNAVERWLLKLREANKRSQYLSMYALDVMLYEYWRRCCKAHSVWNGIEVGRFLSSEIVLSMPNVRRFKDAIKILTGAQLYSLPRTSSVNGIGSQ